MEIITTPVRRARHPFRRSVIAGAAVPVLIAGEFAMMAIVPVGIAVLTTVRNPGLRKLRPWAAALGALYTLALAMWAIGPDRAPASPRTSTRPSPWSSPWPASPSLHAPTS